MAGLNKVQLIGNLGADPEMRTTQNGDKVVNLRVATSETWKDRQGERQERTTWHQVVIWNENLGDVADKYLRKGSKVYLEGSLQTRKWTDKDGQDRYTTEVVLQRFRGELVMLDSRRDDDRDDDRGGRDRGGSRERDRGDSRDRGRDDRGGGRDDRRDSSPARGDTNGSGRSREGPLGGGYRPGGRGTQSAPDLDDEIPF
jgi:single-strand DNA-binding protein